MMELKAALAVKACLRRGFRFFRAANQKKNNTSNHLLEAMVPKANGVSGGVVSCTKEDGRVVRMKIVVKNSELKQLVEAMSGVNGEAHWPSLLSGAVVVASSLAEQRLNLLRKKHLCRAKQLKNHHKCWRPALQSIPEGL